MKKLILFLVIVIACEPSDNKLSEKDICTQKRGNYICQTETTFILVGNPPMMIPSNYTVCHCECLK